MTNLPIGVARTGVTALAMRPGNPPTYVAISADHRVWLSSDGDRWRRGGDLQAAEGGNVWWVRQLVIVGSTFVAFGTAAILEDPGLEGPYSGIQAGYVWTSADGESWARTRLDNFAVGNALVDDGRLVATGGLSGQFPPSFATSSDGKTWSRLQIDGDPWPSRPGRSDWYSVGPLAGNAKAGYLFLSNNQEESTSPDCQGPVGGLSPSPTVPPVVRFAWRSTDVNGHVKVPTGGHEKYPPPAGSQAFVDGPPALVLASFIR